MCYQLALGVTLVGLALLLVAVRMTGVSLPRVHFSAKTVTVGVLLWAWVFALALADGRVMATLRDCADAVARFQQPRLGVMAQVINGILSLVGSIAIVAIALTIGVLLFRFVFRKMRGWA